jgi:hypothetical protein
MDPLDQIKQILSESDGGNESFPKKKKNDEAGEESGESAKEKQSDNVENTRKQDTGGKMPSQGTGEVILKGPGVDVLQSLINKIGRATPPHQDPKAKSTSKSRVFTDLTTTDLGDTQGSMQGAGGGGSGGEGSYGMKEHLDAMFNGENLSEDFKTKAATIFEAALAKKESELRESLETEYAALVEEYATVLENDMNSQIDSYLAYAVNEWVEENRLQLENGVRLEIAESFMRGLHDLFASHGIDVPDSKVDVVDELAQRVEELESRLNEEVNRNIELNEQLESHKRLELVATLGEDLAETQFEKFITLCENVSFNNEEDFAKKITTIRENYFGNGTPAPKVSASVNNTRLLTETATDDETTNETTEVLNESMEQLVRNMSRFSGKRS